MAALLALCCAAAAASPLQAQLLDDSYPRSSHAALRAEVRASEAPQVPFKNFSAPYLAKALAEGVDWRARGAVTPVKDQGVHGFCGTFGRVGSAEGQWALRSGRALTSFSEQMLIDCIGWSADQYSYFSPRGFETSAAYPYNESAYPDVNPPVPGNPCTFDPAKAVPGTPGFFTFRTGEAPDEAQMAAFVYHNGPVSAGIDANVFRLREPGCEARGDCFINATACATGSEMDHSIVIVGFGTSATQGDYWMCVGTTRARIPPAPPHPLTLFHLPFHPPPFYPCCSIKNSWSTRFANAGFINVARGVQCGGLCSDPSICGNVFGTGANSSYFE